MKYLLAALIGALISAAVLTVLPQNNKQHTTPAITQNVEQDQPQVTPTLLSAQRPASLVTKEQLDTLVEENAILRAKLEELQQRLEFHETARREVAKAAAMAERHKDIQNSIEDQKGGKPWSDSDIEDAYPKPFSDYIKKTRGLYREAFHDFQFEPVNEEWAYKMETQIRDFIQLNKHAQLVEISLLDCKSYRCQLGLMVQEPEKKAWKRIFDAMSLEPWFQFHSHSSAPILNDSFSIIGNFFFMETTP